MLTKEVIRPLLLATAAYITLVIAFNALGTTGPASEPQLLEAKAKKPKGR